MVNVDGIIEDFKNKLQGVSPRASGPMGDESKIVIIQDPLYRRLKSTVDLEVASSVYFFRWHEGENIDDALYRALEALKSRLHDLNKGAKHVTQVHLSSAIDNVLAGARYERLQGDGPKLPEVSEKNPFIHK